MSVLQMPTSMVSPLVAGNHNTQLLLEYVTRFKPISHPIQFSACIDEHSPEAQIASMGAISEHVPLEFRAYLQELLAMKRIVVSVVPPRKTRCGDYRKRACGEHFITVNATDNQLSFVLTLLHELAHAFTPLTEDSKPHDKFWKLMFANLLIDCFGFFPPQLSAYLNLLACNPPSSKDICEDHMVCNCLQEGFKEQSLSRIELLRAMMTLKQRFGVNLKPVEI